MNIAVIEGLIKRAAFPARAPKPFKLHETSRLHSGRRPVTDSAYFTAAQRIRRQKSMDQIDPYWNESIGRTRPKLPTQVPQYQTSVVRRPNVDAALEETQALPAVNQSRALSLRSKPGLIGLIRSLLG